MFVFARGLQMIKTAPGVELKNTKKYETYIRVVKLKAVRLSELAAVINKGS